MIDDDELPAGPFSAWLRELDGALDGTRAADVPCDGCTACCTSSQFVNIAPDETETLAHIPSELLFPAPRMPLGHVLLGYDEQGRCPMLTDAGCSIYDHRPRTCRTYDCRVFPATGLLPGPERPLIEERAQRWRFDLPTATDRAELDAVRAAARFLHEHGDAMADGRSSDPTQLAVLALEARDAFLAGDRDTGDVSVVNPDVAGVRVALSRRRQAR